jgi:hypothetical protein
VVVAVAAAGTGSGCWSVARSSIEAILPTETTSSSSARAQAASTVAEP